MSVEVRQLRDGAEEWDLLTEAIRRSRVGSGPVRILEAGCGHEWPLKIDDVPMRITGVDLDADALHIRRTVLGDLDEEVLGDLRTVDLPAGAFDVAYCSYLLEHVEGADKVLQTMRSALRPGGVMIIKVPDGDSVYGFLTKHSPHRLHVLYNRYVQGHKNAGKPGHSPYPTVYEDVVSVRGLREWAAGNGMTVVDEYCRNSYLKAFGRLRSAVQLGVRAFAWFSRGRLSPTHDNIGVILQRQPA